MDTNSSSYGGRNRGIRPTSPAGAGSCPSTPERSPHAANHAHRAARRRSAYRAAEYLKGRLRSPAGELPAGDEALARLVAELVIRAGELEATPAKLELEALQLDLHNLDRRIAVARTQGHERIGELARERQQVLDAIRHRLS